MGRRKAGGRQVDRGAIVDDNKRRLGKTDDNVEEKTIEKKY
jgi:hypothetical protein